MQSILGERAESVVRMSLSLARMQRMHAKNSQPQAMRAGRLVQR